MRPLEGLRILETGGDVAARYCGRLFAALGAEVLREAPARGDELRGRGGAAGIEFGRWLDEGKSVGGGVEVGPLHRFAVPLPQRGRMKSADHLPPRGEASPKGGKGALDAFDLVIGEDEPQADAPTFLSLTWFDPQGPYRDWRGNDALIEAMSGSAFGFGAPEGPPILAQGHGPQIVAGLTGFIAALAALMNAPRPRRVEVNVLEAALCFTEPGVVIAAASGLSSTRLGPNRFSPTYPSSVWPTADGHVGVTALTPGQWVALTQLAGRPELGAESRFATALERLGLADEIDTIFKPIFAGRTTAEWVEGGDRLRIPIAPTPRPGEAPAMVHWRDRGAFSPGEIAAPTLPFRMRWDGVVGARPTGASDAPLSGVRIADFSMGWAGPLAARLLADLGARVLKIESSVRPDWWRGWEIMPAADPPPHELPLNFMAVNRGKRGLDLDLTTADGREAARTVIAASDVVVENLGPGVMERLGLGTLDQRRLRPGVISVSMPPFGRTGPLAGLRAYGSTVEQASGMPFVNGFEHWPPCLRHVAYGDPVAGLYAAAAVLTALWGRRRLGGADIELCQVECLFQLGADAVIGEQVDETPTPRTGSRRPTAAPCCVVRCAGHEAWLAVVVEDEAAWRALVGVLGRPDWASDRNLGRLAGRIAAADEVEAAIGGWAGAKTPAEAAAVLQAAGVAAAPVLPTDAVARDPQIVASGHFATQWRRYVGDHLTPRAPWRFDGERAPLRPPAPILGEHTGQAMAELAG